VFIFLILLDYFLSRVWECKNAIQKRKVHAEKFYKKQIQSYISLVVLGGFAAFLSRKDKNTLAIALFWVKFMSKLFNKN
jgi:hypothetical protein